MIDALLPTSGQDASSELNPPPTDQGMKRNTRKGRKNKQQVDELMNSMVPEDHLMNLTDLVVTGEQTRLIAVAKARMPNMSSQMSVNMTPDDSKLPTPTAA